MKEQIPQAVERILKKYCSEPENPITEETRADIVQKTSAEFDEIITYPPSAAPSGEKQVMSCVQAFTAALGFAMSAGWDLLPSMHTLWLRDYIEAVSMPTPFGFFGTLSGSIFFKMIMLLALCPVMERLFHAFPLDRVAFRRKPFPNADYALLPPALRERIY